MKGDAISNTLSYSLSENFHGGLVRKGTLYLQGQNPLPILTWITLKWLKQTAPLLAVFATSEIILEKDLLTHFASGSPITNIVRLHKVKQIFMRQISNDKQDKTKPLLLIKLTFMIDKNRIYDQVHRLGKKKSIKVHLIFHRTAEDCYLLPQCFNYQNSRDKPTNLKSLDLRLIFRRIVDKRIQSILYFLIHNKNTRKFQ